MNLKDLLDKTSDKGDLVTYDLCIRNSDGTFTLRHVEVDKKNRLIILLEDTP